MHTVIPDAIDDEFIFIWHPKYDETEDDEPEYQRLLREVHSETVSHGSLKRQTFTDILNWKAARVKGLIDWQNIENYLEAISRCLDAQGINKMKLLADLDGIGVPVASTILHFIYPSIFPIIDQRTVDVLRHFGYIEYKSRDLKRYPAFMHAATSIKDRHPRWSLREIDRAVFAYHKQNREIFGILSGSRTTQRGRRSC